MGEVFLVGVTNRNDPDYSWVIGVFSSEEKAESVVRERAEEMVSGWRTCEDGHDPIDAQCKLCRALVDEETRDFYTIKLTVDEETELRGSVG